MESRRRLALVRHALGSARASRVPTLRADGHLGRRHRGRSQVDGRRPGVGEASDHADESRGVGHRRRIQPARGALLASASPLRRSLRAGELHARAGEGRGELQVRERQRNRHASDDPSSAAAPATARLAERGRAHRVARLRAYRYPRARARGARLDSPRAQEGGAAHHAVRHVQLPGLDEPSLRNGDSGGHARAVRHGGTLALAGTPAVDLRRRRRSFRFEGFGGSQGAGAFARRAGAACSSSSRCCRLRPFRTGHR